MTPIKYTGTKREKSVAYKTVYAKGSSDSYSSNYEANAGKNGDAIYETSDSALSNMGSWFSTYAGFPYMSYPFFGPRGASDNSFAGTFYFHDYGGDAYSHSSFRPVLVF